MDYSKAIKKLRENMIISQNELAVILGVSFSSVNRWENGKHEPTIRVKYKCQVKNGQKCAVKIPRFDSAQVYL